MLTNTPTLPASSTLGLPGRSTAARTIMIVNGGDTAIRLLDAVLEAGRYDIVFVESTAHAYSQIKRLQPSLVILCTGLETMDGFQVLSMLKLDQETRGIPVLTYATDFEGQEPEENEEADEPPVDVMASAFAGRMN